ncbi:hypothetical protein T439DRAFT_324124 [Meredithblackwellia eburnea MCA 4105]
MVVRAPATQDQASAYTIPIAAGWVLNIFLVGAFCNAFGSWWSDRRRRLRNSKRSEGNLVPLVLWTVLILQLVHLGFNIEELFRYVSNQRRDPRSLVGGGFAFSFQPLFAGLIATVVQCYLTFRASRLFTSKHVKRIYLGVMGLLILTGEVASVVVTCFMFLTHAHKKTPLFCYPVAVAIWLWSVAAVDILITVALYFNLRNRLVGDNNSTDSIINGLINVTLRTAAYTSAVALLGAVFSVSITTDKLLTNVPAAFYLPLPSLYAFSLFTTLSSSRHLLASPKSLASAQQHTTGHYAGGGHGHGQGRERVGYLSNSVWASNEGDGAGVEDNKPPFEFEGIVVPQLSRGEPPPMRESERRGTVSGGGIRVNREIELFEEHVSLDHDAWDATIASAGRIEGHDLRGSSHV